jgi:hypothetical protein
MLTCPLTCIVYDPGDEAMAVDIEAEEMVAVADAMAMSSSALSP